MKKQLLFATGLIIGICAFAQRQLSLGEAIGVGLQRNYGILIEKKNVEVSENNNEWGASGRLPTVTLNASSNNSIQNTEGERFNAGLGAFPFEQNNQRFYVAQPGLNVNWTLFQGNKAIISKRRFDQLEAESIKNADVIVANTVQAIISAYYLAVLEEDRLDEFQRQLMLSNDKYEYIKTKRDLGGAATSDVLLEENNFLTDSSNVLNQKLAVNNAFRNLNVILAESDMEKRYELTDSLTVDEMTYLLSDLQSAAFSENIDLQKIYLSQAILKSATSERRSERFPTLDFNGGYNWNRSVTDLTRANSSDPTFQRPLNPLVSKGGTYFANFTLSFNLFDGKRINRAIRNAMVQEDIGNLRVDQLKQTISKDLLDAYDQYQVRRQLYEINKRRSAAAEINLQNSQEKFRNGSINSFDFRDVQNNKLTASIQELQAIYNLIDSKITLMRLTGGLLRQYDE